MNRRKILKIVHWSIVPLFAWFFLVQPADVARIGPQAERFHSVLGLVFVSLVLFWTADYLYRGLASTRAPKLSPKARTAHQLLHKVLIWGMFAVALTGFLLGLTSSTLLLAGGIVPIAPPLGLPRANAFVGLVHSIEFYGLAAIALAHATFHIWRHFFLKDNALKIMFPKYLHRFL
jgi:cytochrome b561